LFCQSRVATELQIPDFFSGSEQKVEEEGLTDLPL
jgi:hypothetical protein